MSTAVNLSDYDPYMGPLHAPMEREHEVCELAVRGTLPKELNGSFIRNSGAPHFSPKGKYHWFDGDGMLHSVKISEGRAFYCNRWIRTASFLREEQEGRALWGGLLDPLDLSIRPPIKDTANTDVIVHNGQLIASWWLSGRPYAVDPKTLETMGRADFGGKFEGTMCAHPKVDPNSRDLVFMGFSILASPYMSYGVVDSSGVLKHYEPIEIPHPHIPHDLALTKNYTVLLDMPLGWDEKKMAQGKRRIGFNRERPTRLGVIPRFGKSADVKWFEVDPCYVYHTINAYEDGDEVVLYACRIEDPMPESPPEDHVAKLDNIDLHPVLYRWRLNLATGSAKGEVMDDNPTEFPRTNDDILTTALRYAYSPHVAPARDLMFDGVLKYDLTDGTYGDLKYERDWFGGEVLYVPKSSPAAEDDGWMLSILTHCAGDGSMLNIYDAQSFDPEPIASVELPVRVPLGFHACWSPG